MDSVIIGQLSTISKQLVKFSTVGFFTTLINYAVFYWLFTTCEVSYLISAACGFIIGVIIGFTLNKLWTFASSSHFSQEVLGYFAVYSTSLCIGLSILEYLVSGESIDPRIANIFVIAITSVANFLGIKFWVFKR
jgi:putative flippase GtrA